MYLVRKNATDYNLNPIGDFSNGFFEKRFGDWQNRWKASGMQKRRCTFLGASCARVRAPDKGTCQWLAEGARHFPWSPHVRALRAPESGAAQRTWVRATRAP